MKSQLCPPDQQPESLQRGEAFYATLLSNISDAVFLTDSHGTLRYVCPNVQNIFGWRQDEVVSMGRLQALLGEGLLDTARLDAALETPNIVRHVQDRLGEEHVLLVKLKRVALGGATVLVTCRDITERWQAQQSLQRVVTQLEDQVEERTRALVETNTELERALEQQRTHRAVLEHQSHTLTAINEILMVGVREHSQQHLNDLCLQTAMDLIGAGMGFLGLLNPAGRVDSIAISDLGWADCEQEQGDKAKLMVDMEVRGLWGRAIHEGRGFYTNEPQSHPSSVGLPPGHPTLNAYLGVPLVQQDKVLGVLSLAGKPGGFRDSDLEAVLALAPAVAETVIHKLASVALQRHYRALEAKNAELERFTYTVSHDLKNPLITISGFVTTVRRDLERGNTERVATDLDRIHRAAIHMRRLLDELLELSRIGRLVNPPQVMPLDEVACEAWESVQGLVGEAEVEFVLDPDLPLVRGDRIRLVELLANLLANALRFMGDQPSPRIHVGVRGEASQQVCFVCDNGVGIDPRYHDKVFGLFERLDTGSDGTGIGLAIVQRIVQIHGGRVWVESSGVPGEGSSFCFTLPRVDLAANNGERT